MTVISKNMSGTKRILDYSLANQKKHYDSAFLICGKEGTGKSTLLLQCFDYLQGVTGRPATLDNLGGDLAGFARILHGCGYKDYCGLDEGGELSSMNRFSKPVRLVENAFKVMRGKCLITFICFTNPSKILAYFREDRIRGVFIVKKRGTVYYFTNDTFARVLEHIKRHRGVSGIDVFFQYTPDIIDKFKDYNGPLKESYDEMKKNTIDEALKKLSGELNGKEEVYSLTGGARYIGISKDVMAEHLRKNTIKYDRTPGGKYRIVESELKKLKELLSTVNTKNRAHTLRKGIKS
jgi:hypothetical protein